VNNLATLLAMAGSAMAAYGALSQVIKPGVIARYCDSLHDAGASKIKPIAYSASQIAAGFLLILLSQCIEFFQLQAVGRPLIALALLISVVFFICRAKIHY
jgi:hypothetical protein